MTTTAPLLSCPTRPQVLDGTSHVPNPSPRCRRRDARQRLDDLANSWPPPPAPRMINLSGAPMTQGQLVYFSGHDRHLPKVTLADADDPAKSAPTFSWRTSQQRHGRAAMFAEVAMDTSGLTGGVLGFPIDLSGSAGGIILHTAALTGADQKVQIAGHSLQRPRSR